MILRREAIHKRTLIPIGGHQRCVFFVGFYREARGWAEEQALPQVTDRHQPLPYQRKRMIQKLVLALFFVGFLAVSVNAQTCVRCGKKIVDYNAVAQSRAIEMARSQMSGHLGGYLSGARREGTGYSSGGPRRAVANCCYSGQLGSATPGEWYPRLGTGVARGANGIWYAVILTK